MPKYCRISTQDSVVVTHSHDSDSHISHTEYLGT